MKSQSLCICAALIVSAVMFTSPAFAAENPAPAGKTKPADAPKKGADDKPAAKESVLDKKLPEVAFDNVKLSDAMDFFKDIGGAEVLVDWASLEPLGVTEESTANVKMKNVTVGNALKKIFDGAAKKKGKISVKVDDDGKIQVSGPRAADKKG